MGIDIGTSSVKVLAAEENGSTISAKARYAADGFEYMEKALKRALDDLLCKISPDKICAVALSSQVGTYITDTGQMIPWYSGVGKEELDEIKSAVEEEVFVEEIGMVHPQLISYPLPRLLYIKRNFDNVKAVCMPKERFIQLLTGELVTDTFSQRGICDPSKGEYSKMLLDKFDIGFELPKILSPTDMAGMITNDAARCYNLPEGIPVYVGCNDFFAGLLGMGVYDTDTAFELSGTSEHIGIITQERLEGDMISGGYFNGFATYGGTKASGVSCDFAIENFGIDELDEDVIPTNQPIFLPYLTGERAPIYNENARGVFFGISASTTKSDMAYAVLEGVVFSLYHIYEGLANDRVKFLICGGGSSGDMLMARIKAELFDTEVVHVAENDSSVLGAAIIAMTGAGKFHNLRDAVKSVIKYDKVVKPDGSIREKLLARYEIYKRIYLSLKDEFDEFSKLS